MIMNAARLHTKKGSRRVELPVSRSDGDVPLRRSACEQAVTFYLHSADEPSSEKCMVILRKRGHQLAHSGF